MKTFFSLWKLGAIAGLLSGLSHITLQAFGHISLIPHFLFFIIFGGLQIYWSILFFIKQERSDIFSIQELHSTEVSWGCGLLQDS